MFIIGKSIQRQVSYVSESGHPIICAYNQVSIVIEGGVANDVEI